MNWNWVIGQSYLDHAGSSKESYIHFFVNELGGWTRCGKTVMRSKKAERIGEKLVNVKCDPYPTWRYESCNHPVWTQLGKKWYASELVNGRIKKIIPDEVKLTPLSLAIWYMDDGVNSPKDAQAKLCTNGFTEEEVAFLSEVMNRDLSIKSVKCRVKKHKEQFVLRINRNHYFEFIEMIQAEAKWDCFKYKLDTSLYTKKENKGVNHGLSKLNDEQARSIYSLRQQGVPRKDVAAMFGVTEACVTQIATGQQWKHLGHPEVRRQKKLTQENRKLAVELLGKGMKQHEVAKIVGTSQSSISRLASGKTFKKAA